MYPPLKTPHIHCAETKSAIESFIDGFHGGQAPKILCICPYKDILQHKNLNSFDVIRVHSKSGGAFAVITLSAAPDLCTSLKLGQISKQMQILSSQEMGGHTLLDPLHLSTNIEEESLQPLTQQV